MFVVGTGNTAYLTQTQWVLTAAFLNLEGISYTASLIGCLHVLTDAQVKSGSAAINHCVHHDKASWHLAQLCIGRKLVPEPVQDEARLQAQLVSLVHALPSCCSFQGINQLHNSLQYTCS